MRFSPGRCAKHARDIRMVKRWLRVIVLLLAVMVLRSDNPKNLEWILHILNKLLSTVANASVIP